MDEKIVGLGAGGHAKVVLEILRRHDRYKIIGMLDENPELHDKNLLGIPVLGSDNLLPELSANGINHFFVGLGSTGDNQPRCQLFEKAIKLGMKPVSAIHWTAIISPSAKIGTGATIMAYAVINSSVVIGVNNIINTGAIVEHDCTLGDHVHVASGATLTSTVQVGSMAHIGAGATVRQLINIGDDAVVGAGSVVVKDVLPGTTVVGVPAKVLKR